MAVKYLTKDDILAVDDRNVTIIEVPEWGGSLRIKAMTAQDREKLEEAVLAEDGRKKLDNFRAKLIRASVVDEKGRLLFTEKDITALGQKSATTISTVAKACMKASGFGKAEVDDLTEK